VLSSRSVAGTVHFQALAIRFAIRESHRPSGKRWRLEPHAVPPGQELIVGNAHVAGVHLRAEDRRLPHAGAHRGARLHARVAQRARLQVLASSRGGDGARVDSAVIDGEICCLEANGRSNFKELLFRREWPYFYAFDVLALNGRDVRALPLLERKRRLRAVMPRVESRVLYLDHVAARGVELCDAVCRAIWKASWRSGLVVRTSPTAAAPAGSRSRTRPTRRWTAGASCSRAVALDVTVATIVRRSCGWPETGVRAFASRRAHCGRGAIPSTRPTQTCRVPWMIRVVQRLFDRAGSRILTNATRHMAAEGAARPHSAPKDFPVGSNAGTIPGQSVANRRTGERTLQWKIPYIQQVCRRRRTPANPGSPLRNQQVLGSSPSAGSRFSWLPDRRSTRSTFRLPPQLTP
jgi:hypothetical protein